MTPAPPKLESVWARLRRPFSQSRSLMGWARLRRASARPRTRRLRFTREGRYFVGLTLGVGFAAINTGNNLLYLVLGMMLSMIVVSGILSELALKGLSVERSLPREVHAGSPYLTGIAVHNAKARLASFSVQIEDLIDGHPLAKKCYFLKIPPLARQTTSYRSEFKRRGLYAYRGFHLSTRFPFAFFVKTYFLESRTDLIVLPEVHPVADLALQHDRGQGARTRPIRGSGRDFHGPRPYREGDDARDIHWKRSARSDRLVVREYESDAGRRVGVLLNTQLTAEPDEAGKAELERTVALAASLLVHHHRRGFDVILRLGPVELTVLPDGHGLHGALRALALVEFKTIGEASDAHPWAPALDGDRWLLVQPSRGGAVLDQRPFAHVLCPSDRTA